MADYIRGQTVHFAVTFHDVDDLPFTPDAPKLTIDFPGTTGGRQHTTINLVPDAGSWVADWDSGAASRSGTVYWTVFSGSPTPKIADDGRFTLGANASNLELVS